MDYILANDIKSSAANQNGVWKLLLRCQGEFVPPLSARHDTTQTDLAPVASAALAEKPPLDYFEKLLEQSFVLCFDGEKMRGFLSFIDGYSCAPDIPLADTLYVSTILVAPEARNQGAANGMYERLFAYSSQTGRGISTRTWSTNRSHISILEKNGFRCVLSIPNDRGAGIDTVYYKREAE